MTTTTTQLVPSCLDVTRLAVGRSRPLPGTEYAEDPFWSPDNRWIGFYSEGKLKKIPAAGGAVQLVAETAADFRGGTWAPDSTILFASGSELYWVSSGGGAATRVTATEALHREFGWTPCRSIAECSGQLARLPRMARKNARARPQVLCRSPLD